MKRSTLCTIFLLSAASGVMTAGTALADPVVVTFESGNGGWVATNSGTFLDVGGNPGVCLRTIFNDFGITWLNNSNSDFVGAWTQTPQVSFSIDTRTRVVSFFGMPVVRDLVLELRDYTNPPAGYPWVSVWYDLGDLFASPTQWKTFSVSIADTSAATLPAGWGGYGAEDPVTFEPILPPGRTFASVLAGVDEIALTTLKPGFFYGFTDFDVAIDNVTINRIPEPAALLLLLAGVLCARRRS